MLQPSLSRLIDEIYRLPPAERAAAMRRVPPEWRELVRYFVEEYYPLLERFARNRREAWRRWEEVQRAADRARG